MKRGEVWWVDFEPAVGSEVKKTRPAVILSNDASNSAMSRVQVLPITSNTAKFYVFEAPINVKGATGNLIQRGLKTAAISSLPASPARCL